MSRGVSLANKCQLLFGGAVLAIVAAAMVGPWFRLPAIVDEAQMETSRQIAELWAVSPLIDPETAARFRAGLRASEAAEQQRQSLDIRWWTMPEWDEAAFADGFLGKARARIAAAVAKGPPRSAEHTEAEWNGRERVYRYARLVRGSDGGPQGVVVVERLSKTVAAQLTLNRIFLIAGGAAAASLAMLVFYVITTKIILRPVRVLRDTAERVSQGDLSVRSDLATGDEFEQLADTFNAMLTSIETQQQQLRGINKSLDLRVSELAERNTALYDAARLKGEFLASVSHELRTPLNSIIGFAEILQDTLPRDTEAAGAPLATSDPAAQKRKRYLDNIVGAGRSLLEMINEILAMAKIEAGSIEVRVEEVNPAETCEALVSLIRPLADRKSLRLSLQMPRTGGGVTGDGAQADLPRISTDPQKFQQIVFNFLSNAVKFTPDGGEVVLRAERMPGADGVSRVRVSVLDTGPGIPADQHAYIFEKFSQLDSGHTRKHQGTGLGLAIAKQFAELIQGEIQLVSEPGRGSMFSLIVPPKIDESRARDTKRALMERAALARRPQPPRVNVG
jgi:two-component system sensor histidine kinase BarA